MCALEGVCGSDSLVLAGWVTRTASVKYQKSNETYCKCRLSPQTHCKTLQEVWRLREQWTLATVVTLACSQAHWQSSTVHIA